MCYPNAGRVTSRLTSGWDHDILSEGGKGRPPHLGVVLGSNSYLRLREPRPRFLFVDSDSLVPRSLRGVLSTMRPKWEQFWADTPAQATELLACHEFDAVVAEAELLERGRAGFMDEVRRSSPRTARVVHSVSIEWPTHARAVRGAQFILTKPLDAGEFLRTLDHALEVATATRPAAAECS